MNIENIHCYYLYVLLFTWKNNTTKKEKEKADSFFDFYKRYLNKESLIPDYSYIYLNKYCKSNNNVILTNYNINTIFVKSDEYINFEFSYDINKVHLLWIKDTYNYIYTEKYKPIFKKALISTSEYDNILSDFKTEVRKLKINSFKK